MQNQLPIEKRIQSYEDRRLELLEKKNKLLPYLILFPIATFIITFLATKFPPVFGVATAVSAIISGITYYTQVGSHMKKLKGEIKETLLEKFMSTYYPAVSYNYYPHKQQVRSLLKQVNLIRADKYNEEDVLTGVYKGANFYFSEIHLLDESTDSDGDTSTTTKFRGILFKLKLLDKNFPKTRIQSKRNLLQMIFSEFVHDKENDFWYETEDEYAFQESMQALLPFISHLKHRQGDLRIQAEGNDVTILMKSDMNFLDDPAISLSRSVADSEYKINMAQQLNSLLFIVDSFVNDLQSDEITEKLELMSLEMVNEPLFTQK